MTERKHIIVTPEKRERWRIEMRGWQNAVLTNKQYYDAIDAKMALLKNPTISDALDAMIEQGNADYINAYPYLEQSALEVPFKRNFHIHDVLHIAMRLGHTPEQEQWTIPAYLGYEAGATKVDVIMTDSYSAALSAQYELLDAPCHKEPQRILPAHARQQAVLYAASAYLREKVESYITHDFPEADYAAQHQFAVEYSNPNNDSAPAFHAAEATMDKSLCGEEPYALIKLSPQEWRAIEAVALGLKEPDQTPYPKRLAPIKQAMQHAGLLHDIKPAVQRVHDNFTHRDPEGRAFDPEQFKTAREKRGIIARD